MRGTEDAYAFYKLSQRTTVRYSSLRQVEGARYRPERLRKAAGLSFSPTGLFFAAALDPNCKEGTYLYLEVDFLFFEEPLRALAKVNSVRKGKAAARPVMIVGASYELMDWQHRNRLVAELPRQGVQAS